jgi:leucyl/phenylalanyl-tRNA--protein transferase
MISAYETLHQLGWAHSVEVWEAEQLVGGLYGVALGRAFFGESMFSRVSDASKVALVHLCDRLDYLGFGLIDCQMRTEHLVSLGAEEIPRALFVALLDRFCPLPGTSGSWDEGEVQFPRCPEPAIHRAQEDGTS